MVLEQTPAIRTLRLEFPRTLDNNPHFANTNENQNLKCSRIYRASHYPLHHNRPDNPPSVTMTAIRGKDVALQLYRNILKAHKRYLPYEMQQLGDSYVKSEFKLFNAVNNEGQLDQFYNAWNEYLDQLLQTGRTKESLAAGSLDDSSNNSTMTAATFGRHLSNDVELSDEQKLQLQKLQEETSKARK